MLEEMLWNFRKMPGKSPTVKYDKKVYPFYDRSGSLVFQNKIKGHYQGNWLPAIFNAILGPIRNPNLIRPVNFPSYEADSAVWLLQPGSMV
jgi:hypothetical protein